MDEKELKDRGGVDFAPKTKTRLVLSIVVLIMGLILVFASPSAWWSWVILVLGCVSVGYNAWMLKQIK